jgi:3-carboxy-cis,cis-muconate cycloisomerase
MECCFAGTRRNGILRLGIVATWMALLDPLFGFAAMGEVFTDAARLQRMLDFEAALARAEARCGVIPSGAAPAIALKCKAELLDVNALAAATAASLNPAIPLVKQLTALVAKDNPEAARFVHWGATSQDANDTGLVLQIRQALDILETDLATLCTGLVQLAQKHRSAPIAGRTLMQHALPTTFGVKVAAWLDAMNRHRERLAECRIACAGCPVWRSRWNPGGSRRKGIAGGRSVGGGTPSCASHHAVAYQRDRVAEVATTLGLCTGTLGKIARDISLHMQTEISEVFEPVGEGAAVPRPCRTSATR